MLLGAIQHSGAVVIITLSYCAVFGLSEALAGHLYAPTLNWQVPASWVLQRRQTRRTIVWGTLLGPGLLTRNPYAAMWVIPLLLAFVGSPLFGLLVGTGVGLVHGTFRGLGIVYNVTRLKSDVHSALMAYLGWRLIDGLVLMFLAGFLATTLV